MTSEDVRQELDRDPFVPLRLHLSSGQKLDIPFPDSAFVRQNTLLVLERLSPGTHAIGNYDVISLRLIERIEQSDNGRGRRAGRDRRRRVMHALRFVFISAVLCGASCVGSN